MNEVRGRSEVPPRRRRRQLESWLLAVVAVSLPEPSPASLHPARSCWGSRSSSQRETLPLPRKAQWLWLQHVVAQRGGAQPSHACVPPPPPLPMYADRPNRTNQDQEPFRPPPPPPEQPQPPSNELPRLHLPLKGPPPPPPHVPPLQRNTFTTISSHAAVPSSRIPIDPCHPPLLSAQTPLHRSHCTIPPPPPPLPPFAHPYLNRRTQQLHSRTRPPPPPPPRPPVEESFVAVTNVQREMPHRASSPVETEDETAYAPRGDSESWNKHFSPPGNTTASWNTPVVSVESMQSEESPQGRNSISASGELNLSASDVSHEMDREQENLSQEPALSQEVETVLAMQTTELETPPPVQEIMSNMVRPSLQSEADLGDHQMVTNNDGLFRTDVDSQIFEPSPLPSGDNNDAVDGNDVIEDDTIFDYNEFGDDADMGNVDPDDGDEYAPTDTKPNMGRNLVLTGISELSGHAAPSDLVIHVPKHVMLMTPRIVRRRVQHVQSKPRKTILSSLESCDRDLTDNEFDLLLADMMLPSVVDEEYSTYEYDVEDPLGDSEQKVDPSFVELGDVLTHANVAVELQDVNVFLQESQVPYVLRQVDDGDDDFDDYYDEYYDALDDDFEESVWSEEPSEVKVRSDGHQSEFGDDNASSSPALMQDHVLDFARNENDIDHSRETLQSSLDQPLAHSMQKDDQDSDIASIEPVAFIQTRFLPKQPPPPPPPPHFLQSEEAKRLQRIRSNMDAKCVVQPPPPPPQVDVDEEHTVLQKGRRDVDKTTMVDSTNFGRAESSAIPPPPPLPPASAIITVHGDDQYIDSFPPEGDGDIESNEWMFQDDSDVLDDDELRLLGETALYDVDEEKIDFSSEAEEDDEDSMEEEDWKILQSSRFQLFFRRSGTVLEPDDDVLDDEILDVDAATVEASSDDFTDVEDELFLSVAPLDESSDEEMHLGESAVDSFLRPGVINYAGPAVEGVLAIRSGITSFGLQDPSSIPRTPEQMHLESDFVARKNLLGRDPDMHPDYMSQLTQGPMHSDSSHQGLPKAVEKHYQNSANIDIDPYFTQTYQHYGDS